METAQTIIITLLVVLILFVIGAAFLSVRRASDSPSLEFHDLQTDFAELKVELATHKAKLSANETENAVMRSELARNKIDIAELKSEAEACRRDREWLRDYINRLIGGQAQFNFNQTQSGDKPTLLQSGVANARVDSSQGKTQSEDKSQGKTQNTEAHTNTGTLLSAGAEKDKP